MVVSVGFFVFIIRRWWRSRIDWVGGTSLWWQEDVRVGDEQWFIVGGCSQGGWSGDWYDVFVKEYQSVSNGLFGGVSIDEYESLYGLGW